MSKASDKTFAKFVLRGISYDSTVDFFVLDPTFLEIVLAAVGDSRNLWEFKDDCKKGKK